MAWQALFILCYHYHRDYYYNEVFYFRDEIEGSIGYIFLTLMVATSFKKIASKINSYQWKLIQKSGLYFLWAYAFQCLLVEFILLSVSARRCLSLVLLIIFSIGLVLSLLQFELRLGVNPK